MYVCSLVVSCVADNGNLDERYIFLNEKHTLLYSILSPECWKLHFRALKSQNLLREHTPRLPTGNGIMPLCWFCCCIALPHLTPPPPPPLWLLQLLLKPLHVDVVRIKKKNYFNYEAEWSEYQH